MKPFKFELNTKVMDRITGFTGVITARAEYMESENTYHVEGRHDASKYGAQTEWVGESRIEITE